MYRGGRDGDVFILLFNKMPVRLQPQSVDNQVIKGLCRSISGTMTTNLHTYSMYGSATSGFQITVGQVLHLITTGWQNGFITL